MPACCGPWPVNRNATRAGPAVRLDPVTTPSASAPAANARSRPAISSALPATTAARWAKWARPAPAVKHTSASDCPGASARCAANRAARSRRAAGVRAESGRRCRGGSLPSMAGVAGASSRITWALVPLKPNELTPAMRGPLGSCQDRRSVTTSRGSSSQAMCGLGVCRCRCAGSSPCCSARTTLISPAMPAAASRWPMFVLTDPMATRRPPARAAASAAPSARVSIGSPSAVPVPCVSTYDTRAASTRAAASACRINAS